MCTRAVPRLWMGSNSKPVIYEKTILIYIFWSTLKHKLTFSCNIINANKDVDNDVIFHDTKVIDHPHMVAIIYLLVKESDAEAVVVIISNQKLT